MADAQPRHLAHRAGHRIRDVVQLEVEEDRQPERRHRLDAARALRGEELEPELDAADMRRQRRASARVPSRSGRSMAQKIGLGTAGTGLGGRLRGGRSALIAEAVTAAKAGLVGPGHLRATVASIRSNSTRAAMAFMARGCYSPGHIKDGRSHWIDDIHVSLRGNDVSPRHRHRLPAA